MVKLGGVTHQVEPEERPGGMRKDRTALGRLDLKAYGLKDRI